MAATIAAKETYFNGIKFRSRIEARWAVLFDAIGITYQYEPEKFNLPNGDVYIPDFYLPNMNPGPGVYFEVKGKPPSEEEIESCHLLSEITQEDIFLFHGSNFNDGLKFYYYSRESCSAGLSQCPFCGSFGITYNRFPKDAKDIELWGYPDLCGYHECAIQNEFARRMDVLSYFMDWVGEQPGFPLVNSPMIDLAVSLAKSYRFESPEFQHEANGIRSSIRILAQSRVFCAPVVMDAITAFAAKLRYERDAPRFELGARDED